MAGTVRDGLWIWGQEAGSHSIYALGPSRMTPLEGACYLGLRKCMRVVMEGKPEPPFDQDSLALACLDEVVWSVVGSGGSTRNEDGWGDLDEVLRQARRFPNITGGILDDFLTPRRREIFPVERVREFRRRLHTGAPRALDLWIVVYDHELGEPVRDYLDACDGATFWTWRSEALASLESNFERFVDLTPGKRRLMGCYLFDYGNNREMPVERLRRQCRLGLEWMQAGWIEGLIFCSNCCADLGLAAVEWLRDWIAEIGGGPLPRASQPRPIQ